MSPFDDAHLTARLKGLEATIIRFKDLERTARIDAEYFEKRFQRSSSLVQQRTPESIASLTDVSDGNHFSISEDFSETGIPYYRGQDVVGTFFIETSSPNFITEEAFECPYMRRSHLKRGDVLMSIIGTIGELSVVGSDDKATCSCKLAILRPKAISPELLAVFLRSKHGRNQIERLTRGTVQKGLILEDMDQLWVPSFSDDFAKAVSYQVNASKQELEQANSIEEQAGKALIEKIGLDGWNPALPLCYTSRSEEVLNSGRWDSQFHKPVFAHLQSTLESQGIARPLGKCVSKGRSVNYTVEGEIPIIRSGDLHDINEVCHLLKANKEEPIAYLQHGDVLISSIGFGSIGKVQVFDMPGKFGTVSEVTIIRHPELNPYYLAAFLKSPLGQIQIERYITGATGQLHLYPRDVERIIVPIISPDTQKEFEVFAKATKQHKHQAKKILEQAERAVELAIEEDEAMALQLLTEAEA